jgi:hypothetical protein
MPRSFCKILSRLGVLCLVGLLSAGAYGQGKKPPKFPKANPATPVPGAEPAPGFFHVGDGQTSERSMQVDGGVSVNLCVAEGDLRVNGWSRNEVRVFVKNGSSILLKPLEKSAESGKVNWLKVVKANATPGSECLAGESIEIDAPLGSSFVLSGRAARTAVDSVRKVKVKIVEGTITLRNIKGGIDAYTSQGDVMVENSGGAIALESTTGNIVAVEVTPGQIGDVLKTKTNSGAISLQRVEHRQIDASSISGSLIFDGKFLTGGIYNFRTSNGSIQLSIPTMSSCTFTTTYAEGVFHSELPLKLLTENVTPQAKIVVSTIGKGEAAVNLRTSNGRINIRKQE